MSHAPIPTDSNTKGSYTGHTVDGYPENGHEEEPYLGACDSVNPRLRETPQSSKQSADFWPHRKTVRYFMRSQNRDHIKKPEQFPKGFRGVLSTTETWIKKGQFERPKAQDEVGQLRSEDEQFEAKEEGPEGKEADQGNESPDSFLRDVYNTSMQPQESQSVQADIPAGRDSDGQSQPAGADQMPNLLEAVEEEIKRISQLKNYEGKGESPAKKAWFPDRVDEADERGDDNWATRSPDLIRVTGSVPLNAEPNLNKLLDEGLITPNSIHYIRNHGSVPHLEWATHELEVTWSETKTFRMDDLKKYDSINIPVAIACDGNRRKELNMLLRTRGFDWGPGAISCAYWKGVPLHEILNEVRSPIVNTSRYWVHFEGYENLPRGKYSTCIPLDYALDPTNDVLLAYEMNNNLIPPDHGFPLRVVIPGVVGGRWAKWLNKVYVSEEVNKSYYHIWDNRVLPGFIRDGDPKLDRLKTLFFQHPSTACYEQILNSVIVKPGNNEKISLKDVASKKTYEVRGFAYNGGGHEIRRVEISLDGGRNWIYCIRNFPGNALRHGNKFWAWVHWSTNVRIEHLLTAKSIAVRCYDSNKNTQPENPNWSLTGMLNNCWYTVKPKLHIDPEKRRESFVEFLHPVAQGTGGSGWITPSCENRLAGIKYQPPGPTREFSIEDIEMGDGEITPDILLVIHERVYNVKKTSTSNFLANHPGGSTAVRLQAGRLDPETDEFFDSVHSNNAKSWLKSFQVGVLDKEAKAYLAKKKKRVKPPEDGSRPIRMRSWTKATFLKKTNLGHNMERYIFKLPESLESLELPTGQHIQIGYHFLNALVFRPYTPVEIDEKARTFDLAVKTYRPDCLKPRDVGGTMSNILDCLQEKDVVEVKGPAGEIRYTGRGEFEIGKSTYCFDSVCIIAVDGGIAPAYQLMLRVLREWELQKQIGSHPLSPPNIQLMYASVSQGEILLQKELEEFDQCEQGFQVTHVLSKEPEDSVWPGERGEVTKELLEKYEFEYTWGKGAFLCGPKDFVCSVTKILESLNYPKENIFAF